MAHIFNKAIQEKLDAWIIYCDAINQCLKQYKADEAQWSKSAQAKKEYKKYWADLANIPLFKNDPRNLVHTYKRFLDDGYGLNQKSKAKADFLRSLGFPNINTLETAKKIVENSSLIK